MEKRELGDYQLIKQLGRGSLGSCWLAEQRFTKKTYAIKVLCEELAQDRGFIQRFESDIAKLAALSHPHLVQLYDVSYDQGCYFLVTDCIVDAMGESTNLAAYLRSHPEPLEEGWIYHHLLQIGSALDAIHGAEGKRVVHRGVKLNNILVREARETNSSSWLLSDCGLTRILGCGAVLLQSFKAVADTLASPLLWSYAAEKESRYPFPPLELERIAPVQKSFLQNFAFLAPEQKCIDGISSIDLKADIYSFGVLVYYLLVRAYPEGCFPMPSAVRNELEWNWDGLVRACLQPNPLERPSELVAAIEAIQQKKGGDWPLRSVEQMAHSFALELPSGIDQGFLMATNSGIAERNKPLFGTLEAPSRLLQGEAQVKQYQPDRLIREEIEPLQTPMERVEAGSFVRGGHEGCRDEMPQHEIELSGFTIDIHPVTNEQFIRFLEAMGGEKDSYHRDLIRLKDSRIKRSAGRLAIESGYGKHPVVGVTWYGAVAYAKWVGKRLPTEAEWEIAAGWGKERPLYPTGEEIEKSQANFFGSDTTAVMSYPANELGLYDMAGNVYEWCLDWYGYNYYETAALEPNNPQGPLQGNYRVLRGGCWKSLKEDLRCAKRHRNKPSTVNSTYGFRCASDC